MNVAIFYYDEFCEFEVVLCALRFRGHHFSVALENRIYVSEEKQRYLPDKTIEEVDPDDIDLFIIPGGNPEELYDNDRLKSFIHKLNEKNKLIAGICGGTFLMAAYGLLEGRKCTGDSSGLRVEGGYASLFENAVMTKEDVVVDGNTITSTGQAFVEFAFTLCKIMGIDKDEQEALGAYNWFKNIKE